MPDRALLPVSIVFPATEADDLFRHHARGYLCKQPCASPRFSTRCRARRVPPACRRYSYA
ncbi:conserved protein of unknown function [Ectopseudomonas oleovorans]|uniref:Uncharacterized protein n=1 Tax=Ectopseudomonas oleovorans TaxID=301 RepID=A0A653B857_ECTOL|nr:conserved protein of unknown function [Pseudomonas oleovorans]